MPDEREDAFGEAVYQAWRSGLDPDAVDRDRVDDFYDELRDPFLCGEAEVGYQVDLLRLAREKEDGDG